MEFRNRRIKEAKVTRPEGEESDDDVVTPLPEPERRPSQNQLGAFGAGGE